MFRLLFLLFGLLLNLHLLNAQNNWEKYEYPFHNFKIDFFQKPSLSIDTTEFKSSPLITYSWELKVSDKSHKNVYYSINVIPFPSKFIHSDSSFTTVEGAINATQNNFSGNKAFTFLSSSFIEKQGFPGKVFRWKNNPTNMCFEAQIFLVENTLFQLTVIFNEKEAHNKSIEKYFSSFEFINIPKGNFSIPKISTERTIIVQFPEKPKEETKMIDSEYGKLIIDIQGYELTEKIDNAVYIASETKYPAKTINQNDINALNKFYKKVMDGSLNSVHSQLISVNDIYYEGKLGKELRCYIYEGKALMVSRFFYIGDNVYMLGVMTLPEKDKNKAMIKFFDSFKIKK